MSRSTLVIKSRRGTRRGGPYRVFRAAVVEILVKKKEISESRMFSNRAAASRGARERIRRKGGTR